MQRAKTIGELAKAAGVNVETIRYYQRRGLLKTPQKPLTGQRHYSEAALRQINFIRRAQYLGFTLDEIGRLLTLDEERDGVAVREIARKKAEELGARIEELARMKKELLALMRREGLLPYLRR